MNEKVDPAEKARKKQEEKQSLSEVKTLDSLKASDFKRIPESHARVSHPFEGYPLKPKIEIGKDNKGKPLMISVTFIVGLAPVEQPPQDVSGLGVTVPKYDDKGREIGERIVDLKTYHSRVIRTGPNTNEDVVFDREFKLDGGESIYYAIVKNHSTRAQLAFYYDSKTGRIVTDKRYVFLDGGQNSRLRRLFEQIINPKLRRERMAAMVAGEAEVTDQSLKQLPTE